MERTDDGETSWHLETRPGLVVDARREVEGGSEQIVASLDINLNAPALRLTIRSYTRTVTGNIEEAPMPRAFIEEWANAPDQALHLIDERKGMLRDLGWIAGADNAGKKPDLFYAEVLRAQRWCEELGLPY